MEIVWQNGGMLKWEGINYKKGISDQWFHILVTKIIIWSVSVIANVIKKTPLSKPIFMGQGLWKWDYEILVKLGGEGFQKKGSQKGGDDLKKWESYDFTDYGRHTVLNWKYLYFDP